MVRATTQYVFRRLTEGDPVSSDRVEQTTSPIAPRSMGTSHERVDGPAKVTGRANVRRRAPRAPVRPGAAAPLAGAEHRGPGTRHADRHDHRAGASRVWWRSSTTPTRRGCTRTATARDSEQDADRELMVLQDDRVDFRGQIVAVVMAETIEAAREGAALVEVSYAVEPHEAELRPDSELLRARDRQPGHAGRHRRRRRRCARWRGRRSWSSRPTRRRTSTTTRSSPMPSPRTGTVRP